MPTEIGIVNETDIEWRESAHGEDFEVRLKGLGHEAGGDMLGCSLYELPPGKRSVPFHYHMANEEAMYVLSGEASLRTFDDEVDIRAGDYVTCPVGEGGAHQVINTSDDTVRYLCFSTERDPGVVIYPDSNKVLAASHHPPGIDMMLPAEPELDYWDGE